MLWLPAAMPSAASGPPPTAAAAAPSRPRTATAARALQGRVAAYEMAAGDMADLMGDHGAQLVDRLEPLEQTGVQKNVVPARDESVHLGVLDDKDVYGIRVERRRAQDRVGDAVERAFDLGVADQGLGVCRPSGDDKRERDQKHGEAERSRQGGGLPRLRPAGDHGFVRV